MTPVADQLAALPKRWRCHSLRSGLIATPSASQAYAQEAASKQRSWSNRSVFDEPDTARSRSLNIYAHLLLSPFLAPFAWGARSERRPLPKRAAALWEGPEWFGRNWKAEAAKLPGVGILPKHRPSKVRRKRGRVCRVSSVGRRQANSNAVPSCMFVNPLLGKFWSIPRARLVDGLVIVMAVTWANRARPLQIARFSKASHGREHGQRRHHSWA